jgi:hypothetical protein
MLNDDGLLDVTACVYILSLALGFPSRQWLKIVSDFELKLLYADREWDARIGLVVSEAGQPSTPFELADESNTSVTSPLGNLKFY